MRKALVWVRTDLIALQMEIDGADLDMGLGLCSDPKDSLGHGGTLESFVGESCPLVEGKDKTNLCSKNSEVEGHEEHAQPTPIVEKSSPDASFATPCSRSGLKRCGKSCRLRWLNYLRPNIKHGGFTEEEDNIICALYTKLGSRQIPSLTEVNYGLHIDNESLIHGQIHYPLPAISTEGFDFGGNCSRQISGFSPLAMENSYASLSSGDSDLGFSADFGPGYDPRELINPGIWTAQESTIGNEFGNSIIPNSVNSFYYPQDTNPHGVLDQCGNNHQEY
ncbi:hypothetical protein RHSIM_Rhsim11G0048500 [Rhododendron simsii]|uniref:HTH myb-type domain-containing protein n=1 Tax=Rhododendron simsii TaxID=118357 RepID=A0A834G879_RHOSS|nr:hypothetical protein RHSIM_Rhsim11G0048500 [Rhododendron simsii]